MKDQNRKHISELIDAFVKQHRMESKLREITLVTDWEKLFGKTIDKYTRSLKLNGSTLYVYLSSSVLRQELHFNRNDMINSINEHFGDEVVREIVLR